MIDDAFMTSPDRGCAPSKVADPDIFFASAPYQASAAQKHAAKARREQARKQCRRACPFTQECFTWAELTGQRYGFWGGVDMSSEIDRGKHRDLWNVKVEKPVVEELPLAARVLAGRAEDFRALDPEQQVEVVQTGLEQDETLESLALRFQCTVRSLKLLVGEDAAVFDAQVRSLYEQGKPDADIAVALDAEENTVVGSRLRQDLPALYLPSGRLTAAGVAWQSRTIQALWDQGLSDTEIAEQSGMSSDQVRWVRRERLGLPPRVPAGGGRRPLRQPRPEEELVRSLYDQDLKDGEIAERAGLSYRQVKYIRRDRLGLPTKFGSRGRRINQPVVPA